MLQNLPEIILISCDNDLHLCREYFLKNIGKKHSLLLSVLSKAILMFSTGVDQAYFNTGLVMRWSFKFIYIGQFGPWEAKVEIGCLNQRVSVSILGTKKKKMKSASLPKAGVKHVTYEKREIVFKVSWKLEC